MPKPFLDEAKQRYNFRLNKHLREAVNLARLKSGHETVSQLIRELLIQYCEDNGISIADVKRIGTSRYQQMQQEKNQLLEMNRALRAELDRTRHDLINLQTQYHNAVSKGEYY